MAQVDLDLERLADRRGQAVDGRLDAGADVEDLALGAWVDRGQQGGLDGVVDVGVVARLLAVAVDGDRPPGMRLDEELGDDAAVGVVRPLAWAIDVRVADASSRAGRSSRRRPCSSSRHRAC